MPSRIALPATIATVIVLAAAGCASPSPDSPAAPEPTATSEASGYPAVIDTKFGDVTVPEEPTRVVALGWGDAEVALQLGVEPVGAADWLAFGGDGVGPWMEDAYSTSPEILGTTELSYEAVAALEPDLILDVRGSGDQERYERLSQIATTVGVPDDGDAYLTTQEDQVTMIATALGMPAEGASLLTSIETAFAQARDDHPTWQGTTVSAATRTSEGWGAYIGDSGRVAFLESLGFEQNPQIAAEPVGDSGFSIDLSDERLSLLDADLIVAFPIYIDASEITDDPGWQRLTAVRDGRSIVLDSDVSAAYSLATPAATLWAIDQMVPLIEATAL